MSDQNQVTMAVCGCGQFEIVNHLGKPAAEVRDALECILNISPEAEMLINGEKAADDHIIVKGDYVEFVKASGEKG